MLLLNLPSSFSFSQGKKKRGGEMPPSFSLVIARPKAVTGESAQSLGCVCFFSLQKVDMLECNFLTNQAVVDILHHVKRYRGLSNQYCRVVRDYLICPRNLFLFLFFSSSLPLSCFVLFYFLFYFILFYFLLFFPSFLPFPLSFPPVSLSLSLSFFLSLSFSLSLSLSLSLASLPHAALFL